MDVANLEELSFNLRTVAVITMAVDEKRSLSWPRTDLTRWRLTSTDGAHRWLYLSKEDSEQQSQSAAERHFLGLQKVSFPHQARDL